MELVPAVGTWSPFLYSIKVSIMGLTPLSRSGRPGVRIESVRALTAQPVLRTRAQDRVGRAGLDAADPVNDDRVIGHLPDDAEIVGTNRRSWFC